MFPKSLAAGPLIHVRWRDLKSVPPHRFFSYLPIVDRLRRAVPFDHVAISGLDIEGYRFGAGVSVDTDLPVEYVESYARDELHAIDPFVAAAKQGQVTVEADVVRSTPMPPEIVELSLAFKVHNRTLIPLLRGDIVYGAVTFTRELPFQNEEIDFLALVAQSLHDTVTRPLMERFAIEQLRLSRGEVACLMQASHGLTSQDIARATGYQNDTVNSYIKSAIKKLGAANRTHAIADAIRRNLIL